MRAAGIHQRVVLTSAQSETVLLDTTFDDKVQSSFPIESVRAGRGDRLSVTCTYQNDSQDPVVYSDTSLQGELCTVGLYRYPASGLTCRTLAQ